MVHIANFAAALSALTASCVAGPLRQRDFELLTRKMPSNLSFDRAVPGDSPVRYSADPAGNLFQIDHIDMLPNPCRLNTLCVVKLYGAFTEDIVDPFWSSEINVISPTGEPGELAFGFDLCRMGDVARVEQNGDTVCPPKKGKAIWSHVVPTYEPYTPPGNYTVHAQASSARGTLYDLMMEVELQPDGNKRVNWTGPLVVPNRQPMLQASTW
ncbi:MAG: Phosphatidylglycerol/phosphatidylinositol transfer protein [Vezdaea aestivalis]|nr:MAG: Phosphatidylglycerol/phosphatidylinositol transfer protein [Vezdaea aestivalis]